MTKYCKYHRNNGHTTDECKALQDKIEELIFADQLRWFIKREEDHNCGLAENHNLTHNRQNDHHHQ